MSRRRPRRHRHYEEIVLAHGIEPDELPVDKLIGEAPPVARLVREARRLAREIEPQIRDRRLWVEYADTLQAAAAEREARYFDAGFDHGLAAGTMAAVASRKDKRMAEFARRMRLAALTSGLGRDRTIAALLEVARALILTAGQQARSGLPTRSRRA